MNLDICTTEHKSSDLGLNCFSTEDFNIRFCQKIRKITELYIELHKIST